MMTYFVYLVCYLGMAWALSEQEDNIYRMNEYKRKEGKEKPWI